jgi:prepilin-type N-terminal cleavage/methylation domain-containing protein
LKPTASNLEPQAGFTLVELLVVVTIIVILLALLTPALSRAVYQAELTVCATQVRNIASGVTVYATENKRRYPDRGLDEPYNWDQPAMLRYHPISAPARTVDQRIVLRTALGNLNDRLNDPLAGQIESEKAEAQWIFTPYNLWWGFRYGSNGRRMMKIGERWGFGTTETFDVLASDRDMVRPVVPEAQSSHPDDIYEPGVLSNIIRQDEPSPWLPGTITIALWYTGLDLTFVGFTEKRGPVDDNFAMSDLSVQRYNQVIWDRDSRLRRVGIESNGGTNPPGHYMYVP